MTLTSEQAIQRYHWYHGHHYFNKDMHACNGDDKGSGFSLADNNGYGDGNGYGEGDGSGKGHGMGSSL